MVLELLDFFSSNVVCALMIAKVKLVRKSNVDRIKDGLSASFDFLF